MQEVLAVEADFRVVDESADWIVVDKAAPLVVHPTGKKNEPTLLGGLEALLSYELANGARLSIINRLDRDTSGLVLIAKNHEAARWFAMRMQSRAVTKRYEAIVRGWPAHDAWISNSPILRAADVEPTAIGVRQMVHPAGKPCGTTFTVLERFSTADGDFSRIGCEPLTGRMHQIRVHLAASGHPIVGDKIYTGAGEGYLEFLETGWSPKLAKDLLLPRHALHSTGLQFEDPEGRPFGWESGLPADLLAFIQMGTKG
jgi:23S rRNA pseudouridine1911/1915/1917 synthase